jgi:hypothetical protein
MKTIVEKDAFGEVVRTVDVTGVRKIKEIDGRIRGLDPVGHIQYWCKEETVGIVPIMTAGWVTDKSIIDTGDAYFPSFDCAHISQATFATSRLKDLTKNS